MDLTTATPRDALLERLKALKLEPRPDVWPAVAEDWQALTPELEDWDLQLALAGVALAFATVDLAVAQAAVNLIEQLDLSAKTAYRISYAIEQEATQLLNSDPEAALALVRPLAGRFQNRIKAAAAARIFETDRLRALGLYYELVEFPYSSWDFLKRIVPIDREMALSLAAGLPDSLEREKLLGELAALIAPVDFAQADAICDALKAGKVRQEAYCGLLPYVVVRTPEELFALFANPKYAPARMRAFVQHENMLRAWSRVPLLKLNREPQFLPEVDGNPAEYWDIHRRITYSVESDPAGAFGLLRLIPNPVWRVRIFEYAKAEFLQLR